MPLLKGLKFNKGTLALSDNYGMALLNVNHYWKLDGNIVNFVSSILCDNLDQTFFMQTFFQLLVPFFDAHYLLNPQIIKQAAPQVVEPIVPKEPPPEFEFVADPPSISAIDLYVN